MLPDGRVGFIDFGIVGAIPAKTWGALNGLAAAAAVADFESAARALIDLGATDGDADAAALAADLRNILEVVVTTRRHMQQRHAFVARPEPVSSLSRVPQLPSLARAVARSLFVVDVACAREGVRVARRSRVTSRGSVVLCRAARHACAVRRALSKRPPRPIPDRSALLGTHRHTHRRARPAHAHARVHTCVCVLRDDRGSTRSRPRCGLGMTWRIRSGSLHS